MKKVYIAGKVTGLPEAEVKAKFKRKEEELTKAGYIVYNPVEQVWILGAQDWPWDRIMRGCIQQMVECDEVHLLPCWQQSRGAMLERDVALRLGMTVIYC